MIRGTKTRQQRIDELNETLTWLYNGSANTIVGVQKQMKQIDEYEAELARLVAEEEGQQ